MIALASDHAGLELKNALAARLIGQGYDVLDCGTYTAESCDYPDFADIAVEKVKSGEARFAILVCGTGIGMSMAANKHSGIRAAVCGDCFSAKYTRAHNDANVLCLGARVIGGGLAEEITDIFLTSGFEGGKHKQRIDKFHD